ncbi:MAG: hypothetical protein AB1726_04495 [Planctomycetota bacterium]
MVIAVAMVAAVVGRRGRFQTGAAAVALKLGYVVYVGGDFMAGRFLVSSFVVAVMLLVHLSGRWSSRVRFGTAGGAIALALSLPISPLRAPKAYTLGVFPAQDPGRTAAGDGIADERGFYFAGCGLVHAGEHERMPAHPWAEEGRAIAEHIRPLRRERIVCEHNLVGMFGFFAGPRLHIIDSYALSDPLLARLPVADPEHWRIGHFQRKVPEGYRETIRQEENLIRSPDLSAYYEKIRTITRDPVFNLARIQTILELHLGRYDHWRQRYLDTDPEGAPMVSPGDDGSSPDSPPPAGR